LSGIKHDTLNIAREKETCYKRNISTWYQERSMACWNLIWFLARTRLDDNGNLALGVEW